MSWDAVIPGVSEVDACQLLSQPDDAPADMLTMPTWQSDSHWNGEVTPASMNEPVCEMRRVSSVSTWSFGADSLFSSPQSIGKIVSEPVLPHTLQEQQLPSRKRPRELSTPLPPPNTPIESIDSSSSITSPPKKRVKNTRVVRRLTLTSSLNILQPVQPRMWSETRVLCEAVPRTSKCVRDRTTQRRNPPCSSSDVTLARATSYCCSFFVSCPKLLLCLAIAHFLIVWHHTT
jgi:hypothetical protein